SRIISGKLHMEVEPIELSTVLEAAIESVLPAAEAKKIHLLRVLDGSTSLVSGDSNRLQQVVWNLLSNAIKFTPAGGRVQVEITQNESDIEISVSDTGIGIPEQVLPYVFDRFRQADSTSTRNFGGLGLGLAIVRHLVEMHGGTVSAKSEGEGQGATFTVRIPSLSLHPVDTSEKKGGENKPLPATESVPFECPPELKGLRILLVDDDPDARLLATAILEQCEAKVTCVECAEEALRAIQEQLPDVLVSDVGMPGEDGYSFIKKVRALPPQKGGSIPALALTAYARAEDRIKALNAGFQMHATKPIEPAELVAIVASLTQHHDNFS
ncbi:MAG: response regulator, partial [Cytophagaceae bacterium]